jgi:hypothetical protein
MENNEAISLEKAWVIWRECLKGDDENSIFQQIYVMIWDAAIFRFILEGRQIQIKKSPDDPPLNASFHSFLDRNFFQAQVGSIRRLTENSKFGLTDSKRGIYSLYSLIDDINKRRLKLTRESFFKLRDIPYDYSLLQHREKEFIAEQIKGGKKGFRIPPEFNWGISAEAHATFDRLSGTLAENRKPQDVIAEKVFTRLLDKLNFCQKIIQYVNKYVAHSATPESRVHKNIESSQITLKQIWDAHQVIYEVSEFLSGVLYSQSHFPLAWKAPNLFDNWDVPLVEHQDIDRLEVIYEQYWKVTDKWRLEGVEDLWKWIGMD